MYRSNVFTFAVTIASILFGFQVNYTQCPNNNIQWGSSPQTTTVGYTQTLTTCIYGGEYRYVYNLQAGSQYAFETCGDSDFDTQISIYDAVTGSALAYNDDYCGLQSRATFTSNGNDVRVLVDRNYCANQSSCMTLKGTRLTGAPAVNPCNSISTLSCGNTGSFNLNGSGAWNSLGGPWSTPGAEQVYSFTATITGAHQISVTNSGYYVDLYFKTGSCSSSGWTYLDDIYTSGFSYVYMTAGVTYYLLIDDENTSASSGTITIHCPCPTINVDLSTTDPIQLCKDQGVTQTITLDAGSGYASYLWSTGATSQTIDVNTAGTFSITVTDANGCQGSDQVSTVLNNNQVPNANAGSDQVINCAQPVQLGTNGNPNFSYSWSPANDLSCVSCSTPLANPISNITYTLTVTSIQGCTATDEVEVTVNSTSFSATLSGQDMSCFGICDGSATVSLNGGTSPFSYTWSHLPNLNSPTATGLCAGTYTVDVTDANGCSASVTISITEPGQIINGIIGNDISCAGYCDGDATVFVGGGNYSYSWLYNGAVIPEYSSITDNSCAGTYTVDVTDANGCIETASVTISEPQPLNITTNIIDVSCNGECDGSATVSLNGGTAPFSYSWSHLPNLSSPTATGLCAGSYTVDVTDVNGCTASATISVTEPGQIINGIIGNDVSCAGYCDGGATVLVGSGNYSYSWSNGFPSPNVIGLCPGIHIVNVTDQVTGCMEEAHIMINQPDPLVAMISGTDVTCYGGSDGTATVNVFGGTPPYNILWSDALGQTTNTAVGLSAGNFYVTIQDNNGCIFTSSITLSQSSPINAGITNTDVTCIGACDGTATVVAPYGGTPPYSYSWNDPMSQTTPTAINLCDGNYQVTITDNAHCIQVISVNINTLPTLSLSTTISNVSCNGNCNGIAYAVVNGGTPGYTFIWNDPMNQQTPAATGLCPGTYSINVTDLNGCNASSSVTITEPPVLTVSVNSEDVSCHGGCDGTATATVVGGSPGYTYLWNDPLGQTTTTATDLCAGTYSLIVTDANGCQNIVSVTIDEPQPISYNVQLTNVLCNGGCDGSASITVSGGAPGYNYLWDDPSGQTTPIVTGLCAGDYHVVITDENECKSIATVIINEPSPIIITSSATDVTCLDVCDASGIASASGGAQGYTYAWNDYQSQNTSTATDLCEGIYYVIVTDANNCTASNLVTVNSLPDINLSANTECIVNCPQSEWNFDFTSTFPDNFNGGSYNVNGYGSGGTIINEEIWGVFRNETKTVTIVDMCPHGSVTISFDLYILGSWDGNASAPIGPDGFEFIADGNTLLNTTFSNWSKPNSPFSQFFPYNINSNFTFPGQTGAAYTFSTIQNARKNNAVYHITYTIPHFSPSLILDFIGSNQGKGKDERWGLDNISVELLNTPTGSNGYIDLTALGGSGNYDYLWSNGSTLEDIGWLADGIHCVSVYDANNTACSEELCVTIDCDTCINIVADISCDSAFCSNAEWLFDFSTTFPSEYNGEIYSTLDANEATWGNFGNEATSISLDSLCDHDSVIVSFDLYIIDSWDGNLLPSVGPDQFEFKIDGMSQLYTTFSNISSFNQAYPGNIGSTYPGQTGSVYSYGTFSDGFTLYQLSFTIPHSSSQLFLEFIGSTAESITNESWALDNISIQLNTINKGAIDLTISGGSGIYDFLWDNGSVSEDLYDLEDGIYCVTITDVIDTTCSEQFCFTVDCDTGLPHKAIVNQSSNEKTGSILTYKEKTLQASIYPNPSLGIFNLEIENQSSFYSVYVMDLFGKLIYQIDGVEQDQLQIDLSEQPRGMYFVKVISEDRSVEMKVIKQ